MACPAPQHHQGRSIPRRHSNPQARWWCVQALPDCQTMHSMPSRNSSNTHASCRMAARTRAATGIPPGQADLPKICPLTRPPFQIEAHPPTLVAPSSMHPRTAVSRVAVLATAITSRRVMRLQGWYSGGRHERHTRAAATGRGTGSHTTRPDLPRCPSRLTRTRWPPTAACRRLQRCACQRPG